jgi:hypothetical protein
LTDQLGEWQADMQSYMKQKGLKRALSHEAKHDTQFMTMMQGRAYQKAFDLAREVYIVKGSYSVRKPGTSFLQ